MNFWQTSSYHYQHVVNLPEDKLVLLINSMSRKDIIEWLCWNDPNGIYTDERSLKEFDNILSREEAVEIMVRQCEESRVV